MAKLNINQLRPDEQAALRSWRAMNANAKGRAFEAAIIMALEKYKVEDIAVIDKTPEPFRVTHKARDGTFSGRFSSHDKAQPDFTGTMHGGRSVMFEAKATSGDRAKRNLLTDRQMELLEKHHRMGAITFVAVELNNRYYTVPWPHWRDMKRLFGWQYIAEQALRPYEVPCRHYGVEVLYRADKMEETREKAERW